jgi:hypothetical protein
MEFPYVPSILIILVVAEEHTYFNSEKGRQSIFMLFIQQNRVEMQARKLITNTFVSTRLFATPWECHRLQDCKERRCLEWNENIKKLEELVHFLHDFTRACILFEFAANDPANHTAKAHKSTGSTASFEIHGKYNTNLIDFIDDGAPFDTSGAYTPSVFYLLVNGNGIFVGVAGVVAIVFAFKCNSNSKSNLSTMAPFSDRSWCMQHTSHTPKCKSNRWQWHRPRSCRQSCHSHHLLL